MRPLVLLERRSGDVAGAANFARVIFRLRVDSLVHEQIRGVREGFVAVATVALLETQVDVQVFLVLVLIGKGFVAVFALEFADFPVDDFDVIFEDGGGREFAVAFLAGVAFIMVSVVGPH